MPFPAMLSGLLVEQAANTVVKALKAAYAKSPWARDGAVSQTVERKIHVLVERVAALARSVPPENLDALMEPLIQDFRDDLLEAKLTPADADEVVSGVRGQINATVVQPIRDVVAIQRRLETLEKENTDQAKQITALESFRKSIEESERRHLLLSTVAVTLAIVATLLAIFVVARR